MSVKNRRCSCTVAGWHPTAIWDVTFGAVRGGDSATPVGVDVPLKHVNFERGWSRLKEVSWGAVRVSWSCLSVTQSCMGLALLD